MRCARSCLLTGTPAKISKLTPGDVLQGRLSRDFYVGEPEVFPAGSPVKLTVGKLERRRREPNGLQWRRIIGAALHHPKSEIWRGYWQRSAA